MSEEVQGINSHVEEYLDYYCNLSHPPEFAVLLKGQWGSGKTWFIDRYCEKLKKNKQKDLYISLYGMSTLSEIDDKFLELLYPFRHSEGMKITGRIVKGLLKGSLKIDLDNDGQSDGSVNIQQIPDLQLPKHLKDIDKSILIFDDIERCSINLINLLGYINHFVEHEGVKAILIANEDELIRNNPKDQNSESAGNQKNEGTKNQSYQDIKEKLIGKTFIIEPDFKGALNNFINQIKDLSANNFLSNNSNFIEILYSQGEYENLRTLRQILLDFERILKILPDQAKEKPEILQDLSKVLITFSIEIKRGSMLPKDITKLYEAYKNLLKEQAKRDVNYRRNANPSVTQEEDKEENTENSSLQEILNRYPSLDLHQPFPSLTWWQDFFNKGFIDQQELEKSIESKYFKDQNTPDWVRLWHYFDLSDQEFESVFRRIKKQLYNKEITEITVIKHIFGLFLKFSDAGIYSKSKEEVLEDAKSYINYLKEHNELQLPPHDVSIDYSFHSYPNLGFQGEQFEEFEEFCNYIEEVQELYRNEKLPEDAQELLDIMKDEVWKFHKKICLDNSLSKDISKPTYYEVPILKYISPKDFVSHLLSISYLDKRHALWAIKNRYKYKNLNEKLLDELDWLEDIKKLISEEAERKKGKITYLVLKELNFYLKEAIENLEAVKKRVNSRTDVESV